MAPSISVAIYNQLPFDPVKEFACISTIGYFELVFCTNPDSEFKTLQDFIKAARAQPGKLNVGTINVGGTQNLAAELFKSSAGLNFQIIPYRGTPEVIVAALRNDVQLMVDFYAPLKGSLADKKLRPLAASGTKRSPFLPDVPTVAEAGGFGYEVTSWNGVFAPVGTPAPVLGAPQQGDARGRGAARREAALRRPRHRGEGEHARRTQGAARGRHQEMGGGDRERRHSEAVACRLSAGCLALRRVRMACAADRGAALGRIRIPQAACEARAVEQ